MKSIIDVLSFIKEYQVLISALGLFSAYRSSMKKIKETRKLQIDSQSDWYNRLSKITDECTEKAVAEDKELWIIKLEALLNPCLTCNEHRDPNILYKLLSKTEIDIDDMKDIARIFLSCLLEGKINCNDKILSKNIRLIANSLRQHNWELKASYVSDGILKKIWNRLPFSRKHKMKDYKKICENFKSEFKWIGNIEFL